MFILTYTIFVEKLTGSNAHEINRTLIAKDTSRTAVSSATLCDGTYYNICDFDTRTTYFSLDVTSSLAKIQDDRRTLFHASHVILITRHRLGGIRRLRQWCCVLFETIRCSNRNESYVAHFPASDGVGWR